MDQIWPEVAGIWARQSSKVQMLRGGLPARDVSFECTVDEMIGSVAWSRECAYYVTFPKGC